MTIEKFGRIDFVICGESEQLRARGYLISTAFNLCLIGAAGNFLSPLSGLSENAFRTVIEIDTVRMFSLTHLRSTYTF